MVREEKMGSLLHVEVAPLVLIFDFSNQGFLSICPTCLLSRATKTVLRLLISLLGFEFQQ